MNLETFLDDVFTLYAATIRLDAEAVANDYVAEHAPLELVA